MNLPKGPKDPSRSLFAQPSINEDHVKDGQMLNISTSKSNLVNLIEKEQVWTIQNEKIDEFFKNDHESKICSHLGNFLKKWYESQPSLYVPQSPSSISKMIFCLFFPFES